MLVRLVAGKLGTAGMCCSCSSHPSLSHPNNEDLLLGTPTYAKDGAPTFFYFEDTSGSCGGGSTGVDAAADCLGNQAQFADERRELVGEKSLRAVGDCFVGIGVDLDDDAVGSSGYRSACQRRDQIAAAGAVRGIADDGQVRE